MTRTNWQYSALGEVAEVTAGDPAPQGIDDFTPDGLPFVRMQDVGRYGRTTALVSIKDHVAPHISDHLKRFPPGSILVPKSGASIRLNHRAILGIEAHVVSHLAVIQTGPKLNNRFAYYWLSSVDLSPVAHDADLPSLKTSELAKLQVPVPPLSEQEQIVRILDDAEELRKVRAQANCRTADLIPALFHDLFGDPISRANKWGMIAVEDAVDLVNGRAFGPNDWGKEGFPIIRIQNLKDPSAPFNCFQGDFDVKHRVEKGDLLLSWAGQLVSFGLHIWNGPTGVLNQHIFKVVPKLAFERTYLEQALTYVVETAKHRFHGIEMKHITKAALHKYTFAYPPIVLQREFAARVAEIRAMKAQQGASRRRIDNLFQSLLHRAFAGQL